MSQEPENPSPARVDDGWCFVCGPENPFGLRLSWSLDAQGRAVARFRSEPRHQGWRGVVHGGILAALLDEAMAQRMRLRGAATMTARLSIRYRRPAPVDAALLAVAELVEERGDLQMLRASVRDEGGTVYAEADGTCVRVREDVVGAPNEGRGAT